MFGLWSHKFKAVCFMWKISPKTETPINLRYSLQRENSEGDFVYSYLFIGNVLEEIWTKAPRCAYKRNIILNSVRQHNYFIAQCNYICYMFRILISHHQAYFCQLSHKMLCTQWDPIVFTSMEYIKLNHFSQRV